VSAACIVDNTQAHAHAVHAPAARGLLHAARVQCVRVKKKLAGVLPSFVPCTYYYDLKGFKVQFRVWTMKLKRMPAQCLPMHLDEH